MKKLTYASEEDFSKIEFEVDDDFYNIADIIHQIFRRRSPIIIDKTGKKLFIGIHMENYETYKITIEKV